MVLARILILSGRYYQRKKVQLPASSHYAATGLADDLQTSAKAEIVITNYPTRCECMGSLPDMYLSNLDSDYYWPHQH